MGKIFEEKILSVCVCAYNKHDEGIVYGMQLKIIITSYLNSLTVALFFQNKLLLM